MPEPRIYLPLAHTLGGELYVLTAFPQSAATESSVDTVRAALLSTDPALPLLSHEPMRLFIEGEASLWSARFAAFVFAVFGIVALFLAVLGVYGVKTHAVAQRTREIGIRAALGARPDDLVGLILRQAGQQIGVAAAAGIALALLAGQGLSSLVYHVSPSDPLALIGAVSVLAVTALAACLVPARRAARVDPLVALRNE